MDGGSGRGVKRKHETDVLSEAPRELMISEYVESRASEIRSLSKIVDTTPGGQRISQRLPRHMIRRAMSHNIKRLPQRFRQLAESEYANQSGLTKKVPSRKHRRRPKNLLQDYNRRQRTHAWLETHIWHAKRFHMVEKWSHRLPLAPTDKSQRAAYRASTAHCLIQDISYMCCIEVTGEEDTMLENLAHLTSTETGPTFASKSCLPGTREGHVVLYAFDGYPHKAIGPVSFLWQPEQPSQPGKRVLWMWCHPGCVDEVWTELLKCFQLQECGVSESTEQISKSTTEDVSSAENGTKVQSKTNALQKYVSGVFAENDKICIRSLTASLLRFRLTGPQSSAVLVDSLQQANIVPATTAGCKAESLWWDEYYKDASLALGHTHQREMLEWIAQCQSPAELPPHCVLGLTVQDPRLSRPQKRVKVENTAPLSDDNLQQEKITPDMSNSAIWVKEIRQEVKETKLSDHKLNSLRAEQLVPGTSLEMGDTESRVPVLLLQQCGARDTVGPRGSDLSRTGYGSGWDVIIPAGWGMSFWLSFIFRGARAGGLRELDKVAFEEKSEMFPNDFPDTPAGVRHDMEQAQELLTSYKKKPPAKRPNYTKLGSISPFRCPWTKLVQSLKRASVTNETESASEQLADGSSQTGCDAPMNQEKVFVVRSRKVLKALNGIVAEDKFGKSSGKPGGRSEIERKKTLEALKKISVDHGNGLVMVQVDTIHRGNPCQFAMICIPEKDDLDQLKLDKTYGGPLEPLHEDPRKTQKKHQKELLKTGQIKKLEKIEQRLPSITEEFSGEDLVKSSSRLVIGYLTSGGLTLSVGNGGGKGFCSVIGLCRLLQGTVVIGNHVVVLLRNPASLQYRFARLSLIRN